MSELLAYAELGVRHILDPHALDHVLFIVALAAIYRASDWRRLLWVVSSFTVGHSVTLALAATGVLRLPGALVEFLIPVTIVATCIENLFAVRRPRLAGWRAGWRPVLAGVFGLVHGAGFASYLREMFVDRVALPLLGFNIGVEVGQVVVLLGAFVLLRALDGLLEATRRGGAEAALRVRAMAVSAAVALVAVRWAAERLPWQ